MNTETKTKTNEFNRDDFYWKATRFINTPHAEKQIKKAIKILNKLTETQQWAVRMFGDSRYQDGVDDGQPDYEY